LVTWLNIPAIVVTLATFIGLQGLSLELVLLRHKFVLLPSLGFAAAAWTTRQACDDRIDKCAAHGRD
jgi:ribose/xylose/arabinose/galactoside ABC-type transport system permease subunit